MKSSYLIEQNGQWYCLLPNHIYKEIPYKNWVEDIDWQYVYYKIYDSLMCNIITDDDLFYWSLEELLNIIDVRV